MLAQAITGGLVMRGSGCCMRYSTCAGWPCACLFWGCVAVICLPTVLYPSTLCMLYAPLPDRFWLWGVASLDSLGFVCWCCWVCCPGLLSPALLLLLACTVQRSLLLPCHVCRCWPAPLISSSRRGCGPVVMSFFVYVCTLSTPDCCDDARLYLPPPPPTASSAVWCGVTVCCGRQALLWLCVWLYDRYLPSPIWAVQSFV